MRNLFKIQEKKKALFFAFQCELEKACAKYYLSKKKEEIFHICRTKERERENLVKFVLMQKQHMHLDSNREFPIYLYMLIIIVFFC